MPFFLLALVFGLQSLSAQAPPVPTDGGNLLIEELMRLAPWTGMLFLAYKMQLQSTDKQMTAMHELMRTILEEHNRALTTQLQASTREILAVVVHNGCYQNPKWPNNGPEQKNETQAS